MPSSKPKQFGKKQKQSPKTPAPQTPDEFQEAADFEESAGGKHRAGDAAKSGRAFVRALDIYDQALHRHPANFDLAYNKARLQLEISQYPTLLEHIGLSQIDWLQLTLQSHRHALRLNEENPDVLFNAAQVLTSLAEQLSEDDRASQAVQPLQEALELLSSCLSRQEMLMEQHQLDFPDTEDGGVPLNADVMPNQSLPSANESEVSEQSAVVESPVTASDLLDTVHASLSALTTLVPLADPTGLQTLGDMAHGLTEKRAATYINLMPAAEQDHARFAVGLDRATFIAAFANAQFEHQMIEFQTYVERVANSFSLPGKENEVKALCAEADARKELVLSAIDRFDESSDLPAAVCWKQLSFAQDLCTQATKLTSDEAHESKAETYKTKGDIELLRHYLATMRKTDLSETVRNSAQTLIQNASTFFKGAAQQAKVDGDDDLELVAQQRRYLTEAIAVSLYGANPAQRLDSVEIAQAVAEALESCVDEGLIAPQLAEAVMSHALGSHS